MKNKIIVIGLLLCLSTSVLSQSIEIQKGDVHYEFFQFREAIQDYETALKAGNLKDEAYLLDKLAQCYKYSFQYKKAEEYFSKLVRLGDGKPAPDVYLDYGAILKINGDYNRARDQYRYYLTIFPEDVYANTQLKSLSWAIRNKDSIRNFTVTPTNLNIGGQSLGYCYFDDGLMYSTLRNKAGKGNTVQMFDLDYVELSDSITFIQGDKFLDQISFELNEGSPCVSDDGLLVYFSANATKIKNGVVKKRVGAIEISSDGVSNLKLYVARLDNGKFVSPQELPFNNIEYNCMHPALADNGNTLYFSSDMPKGFGGLDIYKVTRGADGKWGKPENLGPGINTTENEIYPFVSKNVFFFASKGFNGFGGYDLFQAKINLGIPGAPVNMGKPFNSSKDDVAFICRSDGQTGYFSSNRDNDEGIDKVYYFLDNRLFKMPAVAAVTKPADAVKNNHKDKPVVSTAKPAANNNHKVDSALVASKENPVKENAKPGIASNQFQINDEDLLKIVFEKVYFKFNDIGVPSSSYITLDSAIKVVRVSKTVKISVNAHADSRGSADYNLKLSERRAQTVKQYLMRKGVPAGRIEAHGLGETQLLNNCTDGVECTEEQHSVNRRVEVKIVK